MVVVLVVGGVLVGIFARREREPEYGGKRLGEWVRGYVLPQIAVPLVRGTVPVWVYRSNSKEEGVIHIGTNAVPYLLRWIRYEAPPWKRKLYGAFNRTFGAINASWQLADDKELIARGSQFTMYTLRPEADGTLEELTNLLNEPKPPKNAMRAASVLAYGMGNAGLPPLLAALTNQQATGDLRWVLAATMGKFGTNARAAVPTLQRLLTDPNAFVRACATNSLHEIDPQALERGGR